MSIFSDACRPGPLRPLTGSAAATLAASAAGFAGWTSSHPAGALAGDGGWLVPGRRGRTRGIVVGWTARSPRWCRELVRAGNRRPNVVLLRADHAVLDALRGNLPWLTPVPAGPGPSIGMGDRTGYATPGHVAALGRSRLFPVFAQQSVREMTRTGRSPEDVLDDATFGLLAAGWRNGWGADADHLKTGRDIDRCAAAGFVRFTLDATPAFAPGAERRVEPRDRFGPAVLFFEAMTTRVRRAMRGRPFEIEISLDELPVVTRPADHEFVVRALAARGVPVCAVAPRFPGAFEKGVEYRGSLTAFARAMAAHAAVARRWGGYAISVHSGSDKFSLYRAVARISGGRFHVKTAGTSWLEALRVVARVDPGFFREIVDCSRRAFPAARRSYVISAKAREVPSPRLIPDRRLEAAYLDRPACRQVLHVGYGAVLSERGRDGRSFRDRVHRILAISLRLHSAVLAQHLGRHVRLLRP